MGRSAARSINENLIKPTEIRLGVKLCRDGAQIPIISPGNAGIDLRVLTQNGEDKVQIPNDLTYLIQG